MKDRIQKTKYAILIWIIVFAGIASIIPKHAQAAFNSKELAATYLNTTVKYLNLRHNGTTTYNFDIKKEVLKKEVLKKDVRYTWYVKADKGDFEAVTIDSKTGVVTAKKAGTAYIRCKIILSDGNVLRPEAKVVVRNNITEVDISNMPTDQTIVAGEAMDFNRIILNTEAPNISLSKGITRWEIKNDKAGVVNITEGGVVFPTKKGSFSIRAISFQSIEKYRLWTENKSANKNYITASSKWYTVTVKDPGEKAIVTTQAELDKALAYGNFTQITISTVKEIKFTIAKGNYLDKTILVNAPNSEVENYANFKYIKIAAIKDNTWSENAVGNTFYVTSIKVRIIINGIAEVKEIIFDRQNSVIYLEVEGTVHHITLLQTSEFNLLGNGEQIPITIEKTGEGSKITTSIPLNLECDENSEIVLNPGAEGTTINKSDSGVEIKVENNSGQSVVITAGNNRGETIKAGESGVSSGTVPPSAPPVILSSIAIKAPATKLVYTIGETLDIVGLIIEGTYSNSNKMYETITTENVTGFDSSTVTDSQTLTVNVKGKTVTYLIEIKVQLTISDPTISLSKVYDGTSIVAISAGTLSGVLKGDAVDINALATYEDNTVGEDKTITVVYTLSGVDRAKYRKPSDYVVETGSIAAKPLTISGSAITTSKVYDSSLSAVAVAGTLLGVLEGDTVTVSVQAAYKDKNVGKGKPITVVYTLIGEDAANYTAAEENTVITGEITEFKLPHSFVGTSGPKVYDGNRLLTSVWYDESYGIIAGDNVIVSAQAFYDTKNVGSDKYVTIVFAIEGADVANYIKPDDWNIGHTKAFAITQKKLNIADPVLTTSKLYDGTTTAEVTAGALEGVIDGDDVTVSATATYKTAEVGEGNEITVVYKISGKDSTNYLAPDSKKVPGIITAS